MNALEQDDKQTHDRQRVEQYRQDHKEQINERARKHYAENKEKISHTLFKI